ncbi:hypothetical protein SNOG_01452 [Parastagonospora nodorum SN15]|uniref:Aminoglycoside phosphotransferase domain-containing protein n=1 Tax=Phaeosphaeria nodorum (strain SN15 / ATCC MYA-4574 / FGSC 10173) TaxID=321614 RepID=Q0V3G2_PHANO|nr:hypothetical protein SNOG_01452 [Parastagonospora nodorum SN15]EAT91101.2 hypothetical protein SNOG_01452 [Parastagonospora nodorum SN15]
MVSYQNGLEWVSAAFGLEPRWTQEPDVKIIAQIARKHLDLHEQVQIDVSFHAQGAFNKLYKITAAGRACLMRISLPVYPRLKTQSEVATINFVRQETDMPVPRILAFDASNKNELGFEWIMMEMVSGTTLRKQWRKISWEAKQTIVRQLAHYHAQLYEKPFPKIGNLFPVVQESAFFELGPIVSLVFFWGDHLKHDVPRGPFKTSYEWLKTRLTFALADQQRILETSDDEDDIEDAEFSIKLAEDVAEQLPKVFPPEAASEQNVLFHDDLSMQNIMVDETGKLAAIVDWEYDDDEEQDPDAPDNEGVNSLYWEHLLEYEQTELRKLFKQEMAELNASWVATMESSTLQSDFEQAIHNCDNNWQFKVVRQWLDAFKQGDVESLAAKMIE